MIMIHKDKNILIDWIIDDKILYIENSREPSGLSVKLSLDYIFTEYNERGVGISNYEKDFRNIWESNNVNDC